MAKNNNTVLLGYEDELITEKHKGQVDFTVNKIGGEPNFPTTISTLEKVVCALCKIPSRLVVQIHAPLENSKFHRTLYIFACLNPPCWNRNESWTCLRIQMKSSESSEPKEHITASAKLNTTDWCSEANDWGEDENNANLDEENCNVINNLSEEEEESSSMDDSVRSGFRNLSIDEKNANSGAQKGAVARLHPPMATAEIEADEDGEVVTVETPITTNTNLVALLQGGPTDMDMDIPAQAPFVAYFMSVYPEEENFSAMPSIDNHVKELLSEYQRKDADFFESQQEGKRRNDKSGGGDANIEVAVEEYEKSRPLHGDKMFHHFLTKIKSNPDQILRYDRAGHPLLLYPLQEPLKRCKYCQAEQVFEFQLVPTIISKLRLECDPNRSNRLDFGTVLIYTCKNSCWDATDVTKEETIIVQKETF